MTKFRKSIESRSSSSWRSASRRAMRGRPRARSRARTRAHDVGRSSSSFTARRVPGAAGRCGRGSAAPVCPSLARWSADERESRPSGGRRPCRARPTVARRSCRNRPAPPAAGRSRRTPSRTPCSPRFVTVIVGSDISELRKPTGASRGSTRSRRSRISSSRLLRVGVVERRRDRGRRRAARSATPTCTERSGRKRSSTKKPLSSGHSRAAQRDRLEQERGREETLRDRTLRVASARASCERREKSIVGAEVVVRDLALRARHQRARCASRGSRRSSRRRARRAPSRRGRGRRAGAPASRPLRRRPG